MRGEALNMEREAAEFESEAARKELENVMRETEDAIRGDKMSLLARQQEVEKLEQEEEKLGAQFPAREAGLKAVLDHMKKMDQVRDKLTTARTEAGRLLWDLRARHSDLQTYKDRAKDLLPPAEVKEIKFPPFTAKEEAWFQEGDKMTAKWGQTISEMTEAMPFTPDEEEWFKRGEQREAA